MAMDGGDTSVADGGAADHGRRPPRGRGRRAGRILGAVAAGAGWVLALGWSIGLLGAMGVAAAGRFDAAVARFDERMAASEIAFEAMEAEIVEAELALERSDGRVHDPEARARLHAAHADAGREIDRLEDALAGQVVVVESAPPLLPAWLSPHLWHGAARDVDTLDPPSNADFQGESAELMMAAGAVDRSMAEWEVLHADEVAAALAARIEADSTVGRGLPDGRTTDGFDAVLPIATAGGDDELEACLGVVDLRDYVLTSAMIGALWECGGSDFPRWPGATVRLTGLGFGGEYRVTGTVGYVDMAEWESSELPAGHDLLFETSVPETGEFVYVGLELVQPLPDLPGSIT